MYFLYLDVFLVLSGTALCSRLKKMLFNIRKIAAFGGSFCIWGLRSAAQTSRSWKDSCIEILLINYLWIA